MLISQTCHNRLCNLCNSLKGYFFLDILAYSSTGSANSGLLRSATIRPPSCGFTLEYVENKRV